MSIHNNKAPPIGLLSTAPVDNRNLMGWGQYYADSGLLVLRIHPKEKKPDMGKGWEQKLDSHANVTLLHGNSNIGIRVGKNSNNLCDIDLDHPNALIVAPLFLPTTATFGRLSAPNSHWEYFLTYNDPDEANDKWYEKFSIPEMGTIAEFRFGGGDKGRQTVFPPSIHEGTEELIQWSDEQHPVSKITTINASVLKRQFFKMCAMCVLMDVVQDGWFHNATVMIAGMFRHLGWPVEETEEFILHLVDLTGMEDVEDRMNCVYTSYVDDPDKHIGGFGELKNVFKLASLDGDHIVNYLRNTLKPTGLGKAKMDHPRDVFQKLSSTSQQMLINRGVDVNVLGSGVSVDSTAVLAALVTVPNGIIEQGVSGGEQVPGGSVFNPVTNPDPSLINQTTQPTDLITYQPTNQLNSPPTGILLNPAGVSQSQSETQMLESFNSNEVKKSLLVPLVNGYTEHYLIEGLLPEEEVGLVIGESGSYKSYLMVDMAMSMVYKDAWVGKQIHDDCGDILWCAGEGSKNLTGRIEMWKQENLDGTEKPRADFLFYDRWLDLFEDPRADNNGSSLSYFGKFLKQETQVKTVIMDTWSSLFSGDENSNSDTARAIKSLNHMAVTFGVTFIIVHHKDKAGTNYRGASALIANSDFNFDISKEYIVASNSEKITKDTPTSGRIIFEDKQQRSGESNTKIYFKPKMSDLMGCVNNFGTQLKNIVMIQQQEGTDMSENHKTHHKITTGKYGINSLIESQRDTFNYVQEIIFHKVGSGTVGMCLSDLHDDAIAFRAYRGQKSPGRIDGFGRKIDGLVEARVLIKTRAGGEEWLQIGEDRYIDPDYKDSVCPVKPAEMRVDNPENVFPIIPADEPDVLTKEYSFLD